MNDKLKKEIKINERERKVLKALVFCVEDIGYCIYFRGIAEETRLKRSQVRLACRSLARKGLTRYERGLFDDDGMVAGSGYCATEEGAEFIESNILKK